MPLKSIAVVYRKELTEALRDRRTLISTIVVPLLLFPVMSVGFASVASLLLGKAKEESAKVMVLGGDDSPAVMEQLKKLDKVAYVRFASVYLDFKDVKEFMDELKGLLKDRAKK